jgi:hypothetical protein
VVEVTQEYQLGHATIDGEFYVFVDTPGFDDPKTTNEAVFRNIADVIEKIIGSVKFAGVLYVHPMRTEFNAGNSTFIRWLDKFCGTPYSPQVAFVTTKWDTVHPRLLGQEMKLLDQWKNKWSDFLDNGAFLYHHGKGYNPQGIETGEILYIDDAEHIAMRRTIVRNMISRHYGHRNLSDPLYVQEVKRGISFRNTSAAGILGIHPQPNDESGGTLTNDRLEGEVNWLDLFMNLILWPFRKFWSFVQWLISFLPPPYSSYIRLRNRCLEVVFEAPGRTRFVVGYDPHSVFGVYVRLGPDDQGNEQGTDYEEFEPSVDCFEDLPWPENSDQILPQLGTTPEEAEFANAFRAAWNIRDDRGNCICM